MQQARRLVSVKKGKNDSVEKVNTIKKNKPISKKGKKL